MEILRYQKSRNSKSYRCSFILSLLSQSGVLCAGWKQFNYEINSSHRIFVGRFALFVWPWPWSTERTKEAQRNIYTLYRPRDNVASFAWHYFNFSHSLVYVCVCLVCFVRSHTKLLRYFSVCVCGMWVLSLCVMAFTLPCCFIIIIEVNCRRRNWEICSRSKDSPYHTTIYHTRSEYVNTVHWTMDQLSQWKEEGGRADEDCDTWTPNGIFSFHFIEKYWNIKSNRNFVYTFLQFHKITLNDFHIHTPTQTHSFQDHWRSPCSKSLQLKQFRGKREREREMDKKTWKIRIELKSKNIFPKSNNC